MSLRIIHITASYKPAFIYGGPIQSVGKLCEALVQSKELKLSTDDQVAINKYSIQVLTTTANGKAELNVETGKQQSVNGVPVTYYKRWTKDHSHFSFDLLLSLQKEILRSTQDDKLMIHIHGWWNLISVLGCLVAKWHRIPVVLSPRGMLTVYTQTNRNANAKRIFHKVLGKRLLKYCHIHATSDREKTDILKIISSNAITVIPNLVNLAKNIVPIVESKESIFFNLIFLSRIEEKKGLELLFDALATIDLPWRLTIAGTGEENYVNTLTQKAKSLKLNERIKWVGQIADDSKFDLLANHDLLLLPSYNENFANVVVESLSVGTAVLVSEKVGLADYVKKKDLGWVCSLTPGSIQLNLLNAFKGLEKRSKIRSSSNETVKEDFCDQILLEKYLQLYKSVLNQKGE